VNRWTVMSRLAARRVVAIVRATSSQQALEVGSACIDAGLDVIEVSLTTPGALEAIAALAKRHEDAVLGAGTVLDAASGRLAILAGARFLVAPNGSEEVVRCAHRYGAAVIPGAATPTEVMRMLEAGADAVKIFPARNWSPSSLHDLLVAVPHAPLVPTGGVNIASIPEWLAAGAVAVGVGGELTSVPPEALADRARQVLTASGHQMRLSRSS